MGSWSALALDSLDLLKGATYEDVSPVKRTPKKNSNGKQESEDSTDYDTDITPVKTPLPSKRRSLMRDMMNWDTDVTDTSAAKHPMQMRSRRCRKPKKDYCKPEDYVDYGDDLSFLFDDDLPNLNCRPRKKYRKKRPHLLRKEDTEDHQSSFPSDRTTSVTSCCDVTTKDKDEISLPKNPKVLETDSRNCNLRQNNTSNKVEKRKIFSATNDFDSKRQKVQLDNNVDAKYEKSDNSTQSCWSKKISEKKGSLRLNCNFEKSIFFTPKVTLTPIPENTVTKMILRRRHSTPTVGGAVETFYNGKPLTRTLSVGVTKLKPDLVNKEGNPLKSSGEDDCCVDIEFVDSPDSGFSSEASCSAGTPDVETVRNLNIDDHKRELSRVPSHDSGIVRDECPEDGYRLNLDGAAVLQKERLERERKRKEEEQRLREKFRCRWTDCLNPVGSLSSADLHQHLEKFHSENYCCKWEGCKVYGKMSRKLSFLQRHIAEHSGEKPYKCILDGCDATFSSICGRKRHVEAHYSEVSYPKARVGGESSSFSRYLLNSRRIKDKRRTLANRHDCMDNGTMSYIRRALIQNEVAMETQDDVVCDLSVIKFKAEIIGRKRTATGQEQVLVKWRPANLLPNEWMLESEFEGTREVNRIDLPDEAKDSLKELLFFRKRSPTRKTSLLQSMFPSTI